MAVPAILLHWLPTKQLLGTLGVLVLWVVHLMVMLYRRYITTHQATKQTGQLWVQQELPMQLLLIGIIHL